MINQQVTTPYINQNLQGLLQSPTPVVQPTTSSLCSPYEMQTVQNIQSAENFQMGVNQTVPLFDMNEDVFYIKRTDSSGAYTIDVYEYHKREEVPNDEKFVTKEEFEELKNEIKKLSKSSTTTTKTTTKK